MHFSCAARTDVGVVRSGNEDSYLMLSDRGIFVVADGMGGHAAGEVASEMATRIIAREIGALRGVEDEEAARRLQRAIVASNESIYERTLAEHDKRGMGTTATVLVLMLVIRPLDVAVSTLRSSLSLRDRAFLAWLGPRGIVAAVTGYLAARLLAWAGMGSFLGELIVFVLVYLGVTLAAERAMIAYGRTRGAP